uniref:Uncharacterized protein n=1 Tax=Eutreptiella gymnastica TaxID=73025 RepID=A0A7S4C907_9EUGL
MGASAARTEALMVSTVSTGVRVPATKMATASRLKVKSVKELLGSQPPGPFVRQEAAVLAPDEMDQEFNIVADAPQQRGFISKALGLFGVASIVAGLFVMFASQQKASERIPLNRNRKWAMAGTTASPPSGVSLMPLQGSTIVIFGGSSGIGKALACEAAKQGAARMFLVGRDAAKLADTCKEVGQHGSSSAVEVRAIDACDEEAVRSFFADEFADGEIDYLVTTPGDDTGVGSLAAPGVTCDAVRQQLDRKLFAQLAAVFAAGDKIRAGGAIVMVSGVLSRRPGAGMGGLAMANAAIETAVKVLANDFGYDGKRVRVNCLSPGLTDTPVHDGADQLKKDCAAAVPLQRIGTAEEMAHTIVFLLGNEFVTGVTIDVDGGFINMP